MLAGFTSQLMQMPFQEVYQRPMPICASPSPPCEDRLSHSNIPTLRGATCKIMTCKTNARGGVLELQWRSRSGKACGGGRRGVKCRPTHRERQGNSHTWHVPLSHSVSSANTRTAMGQCNNRPPVRPTFLSPVCCFSTLSAPEQAWKRGSLGL